MNRYPLWKYLLILLVVVVSFIYAAPNLYAPDPAIQISGERSNMLMDQSVLSRASEALDQAGIDYFGGEVSGKNVLLRLKDKQQELAAKDKIKEVLGVDFIVALNSASNTPQWLADLGGKPLRPGLDLSGGIHFLLQVDTHDRMQEMMESQLGELKKKLREEQIRGVRFAMEDNRITATCQTEQARADLKSLVRSQVRELDFPEARFESEKDGQFLLNMIPRESWVKELVGSWVEQNLVSLRNRVNELGVSEPIVQRQGKDRIVVQLPGIQDTAEAKKIINKTATLEFRLKAKQGGQTFRFMNDKRPPAKLERKIIITGESVTGARVGFDEEGNPAVDITLDSDGGAKMGRTTTKHKGEQMAMLFVEQKSHFVTRIGADGKEVREIQRTTSKEIISMPVIRGVFGSKFQVTGLDSPGEAKDLALLLRAGALAAPMVIVEERTIGPSLGAANIEKGITSVQLGMALVLLFMLVYYKVFGIVANLALGMNIVILIACMSMFGAILTLPGIAGIVLTVGMAVDANVLIFSRIKEEMANGLPPQSAISAGYDRAFVSIFDANITTLIVALILFMIGSGPVKGFAVTLSIGILTSMFTSILGTRALVNLVYGGRKKLEKLWI